MNFMPGQAAEPVMAKSLAVLTMAFVASTLVMTPGGIRWNKKKGKKKLFPPLFAVPPMPSTAPLPWEIAKKL